MRLDWILAAARVDLRDSDRRVLATAPPNAAELAAVLPALERHGILGQVDAQLEALGLAAEARQHSNWQTRLHALRQDGLRDRLTLERALRAASHAQLQVILLKGASLSQDLYREPGRRAAGDLDLLVRPEHLEPFLAHLAKDGFLPPARSLPRWWYRLTHFHLKLRHALPMCKEIEVHWHLHHAALGLAVGRSELWNRAQPVTTLNRNAFDLDPLDRWLHLATHFASHGVVLHAEDLADLFTVERPRARWKWVVDLVATTEALAQTAAPALAQRRVEAWNARTLIQPAFSGLQSLGLPSPVAANWLAEVGFPGSTITSRRRNITAHRPETALDFRIEALRGLPRFILPSLASLRRTLPVGLVGRTLAWPFIVLLRLGQVALAALLLPAALLARLVLTNARSRARAAAESPAATLDIVSHWLSLGGSAHRE